MRIFGRPVSAPVLSQAQDGGVPLPGPVVRTEAKPYKPPYINERKKFELIIAASGQVVYDYDLPSGDILWSGNLEQVLGYEAHEMGGVAEWAERIHPEDRDEALRLLDAAEKDRTTYDVDYRFRLKNGGYRWLHDRGFFLIEDDRNLRRMIGMMQDIHDRKQAEILQNAVYRIAQAADTSAGTSDLFRSVHETISTVMPAGNFYIALYDAAQGIISFPYFVDEEDAPPAPITPGKGLTEYVIRTGRPLLCDEATDKELRGRGEVEVIGAPSAIWLGVPLIVDGKTIGAMVVQHYSDPSAYGPRELRMLEYVSSQVARSIERKRGETALRDSEELYRRLVAAIPDIIIRTDLAGTILFANDVAARLNGNGDPQALVGRNVFDFVVPQDRERAREAMRRIFDVKIGVQQIDLGFANGTVIPFEIDAAVLRNAEGTPYGIVYLCRNITERKRAETDLREGLTKLRSTLKASIDSLASAIEMRDPYTAGHQERVTDLARAIAVEMGLAEERVEAIEIAGVIHDIGKLYVPAEILSKPTKLTDLEYALIKMHAQAGYTILSKIDFPWPIARIVHEHHELVNGSGYPQGLAGKDILLEARIICVADVVEAMSSHRPYRPALGVGAALEEIAQKRGILYDRDVVDACLKIFREKLFKFD